jgi:hypothetical protein
VKHDIVTPVPRMALSLSKVAIALDVSPNTVLQMVEQGRLPRPKVWGRRKLWRVVEIDAALAEWPSDREDEGGDGDDDEWVAD